MYNLVKSFFVVFLLFRSVTAQQVSTLIANSTFNDGLSIDTGGNIYASRYAGSTVTKITPAGQASIFVTGLNSPNGLAFGPDGCLYIPNAAGNTITKVTPEGVASPFITISNPAAIFFNKDGSMLVADYNSNKISLIDTGKNISLFLSGSPLNGPIGLARDSNDSLYIGNFTDGKIFRYSAGGNLVLIGQLPGWLGFMTISNNMIFATGYQANRIYKIPLDGTGAVVFAGTGGAGTVNGFVLNATFLTPNGIVATPTGDTIYVSQYQNRTLRMISGVNKSLNVLDEPIVLSEYDLSQNYPNPFNPSTIISYHVPVQSFVTIKVYSLLGSEVSTLIQETVSAGKHHARMDGTNLSSGTYVVRMSVGGYSKSVKANLLR